MTNTTTDTAREITDAVRAIAHWSDQQRRARTERDRAAAALVTLPSDSPRRTHLESQVRTLTERAKGSTRRTEESRARLTALTSVTVTLPGGFCDYFEGTGIAQGTDNADPIARATKRAWDSATRRRYGRNGYAKIITTDSMDVLETLDEYTEYCLNANLDEPVAKEVKGAHEAAKRIRTATKELRALLALRKEAEEAQAAHEEAQATQLAAYDAQLTTPQGAQEPPAADPAALTAARLLQGLTAITTRTPGTHRVNGMHVDPDGRVMLTLTPVDGDPFTAPLAETAVTSTDRATYADRVNALPTA